MMKKSVSGALKGDIHHLVTNYPRKGDFFVDSLKSMDYIESSYDGIDKETENLGNLW